MPSDNAVPAHTPPFRGLVGASSQALSPGEPVGGPPPNAKGLSRSGRQRARAARRREASSFVPPRGPSPGAAAGNTTDSSRPPPPSALARLPGSALLRWRRRRTGRPRSSSDSPTDRYRKVGSLPGWGRTASSFWRGKGLEASAGRFLGRVPTGGERAPAACACASWPGLPRGVLGGGLQGNAGRSRAAGVPSQTGLSGE